MRLILCLFGWHDWHRYYKTKPAALHRYCICCGKMQKYNAYTGLYTGRNGKWVKYVPWHS